MKIKFLLIIGFVLSFLVVTRQAQGMFIADGERTSASYPRNPPPPAPKTSEEKYSKTPGGTELNLNTLTLQERTLYYTSSEQTVTITSTNELTGVTTTSQKTVTVWSPNENLQRLCIDMGGCEKGTILAKYEDTTGNFNAVINDANNPTSSYGQSGTSGNQYIENTAQEGVAGFYKSDYGGWYPISLPPPPRNPGEPYNPPPDSATPTPTGFIITTLTPTPTPYAGPWTRLKDSSYASRYRIQSYIPASPVAYDSEDTTEPYFIIGDGGAVVSRSISIKGLNNNAKASAHDWQLDNYKNMPPPTLRPADFELYVRGRKEHKEITNLNEIDGDGIYTYTPTGQDLNIDTVPAAFNQYNVVLLASVTVNINVTNSFNPSKSVAIIAPTIKFSPSTTDAKGIFIASLVDTGTTTNQGLKITGNLISQDYFNFGRRWSDLSRPALFIVFKPELYLDLFPYLSVANYNWQQTQ